MRVESDLNFTLFGFSNLPDVVRNAVPTSVGLGKSNMKSSNWTQFERKDLNITCQQRRWEKSGKLERKIEEYWHLRILRCENCIEAM